MEERGYGGSCSSVQRCVREWRLARAAGAGDGHLEPGWAPGTAQADYGSFEAVVASERLRLKLLVVALPHSNARFAVAGMSRRAECMCAGLAEVFGWVGRAPRGLVLDNATEAGRRVRGEVTESHLFSLFRAHYRMGGRYRNPNSGNEKGSAENAVGFIRRNLPVPVPRVGSLAELDALLRAGCDRLNASSRARDGRLTAEALPEDLAAMLSLPSAPFDAVRWVRRRADKRGAVTVDGRGYLAGPAWHSRELLVGVRAGAGSPRQVEYLAGYLEAEAASRDASKRATLLRRCGLPAPKTFDGYDWSAVSWPEGLGREDLLPPSFLERREGLVLMGDVGTGKTHMAGALCQLACDRRLEARFFTASTLVMRLRRAREEGRLDREMSQVARARLLVIDELGFLPLDADGARLVFQVFADAYERQSVVITTNLEFSRWGGVFGDDQMAAAVIDRVVHHGRLVQFRGESHRVRHALMQEG